MRIEINDNLRLNIAMELLNTLNELYDNTPTDSYDYLMEDGAIHMGIGSEGDYLYVEDTNIVLVNSLYEDIHSIYESSLDGTVIDIPLEGRLDNLDNLGELLSNLHNLEDTIRGDDYESPQLRDDFIEQAEELLHSTNYTDNDITVEEALERLKGVEK